MVPRSFQRGHYRITPMSGQLDDGQWVGSFYAIKIAPAADQVGQGFYVDGTFKTKEQAEEAGVRAGNEWADRNR